MLGSNSRFVLTTKFLEESESLACEDALSDSVSLEENGLPESALVGRLFEGESRYPASAPALSIGLTAAGGFSCLSSNFSMLPEPASRLGADGN